MELKLYFLVIQGYYLHPITILLKNILRGNSSGIFKKSLEALEA